MDLAYLRPLYEYEHPYASVYLATARDSADAAKAIELRWKRALKDLHKADSKTRTALEDVVFDPAYAAPGRALFAADGTVVHHGPLPTPPVQESARYSALPHVMPLLSQRAEPVPHVRVLADRTGADITTIGESLVEGADWPIQQVREGGLAQQRHQRSAVETWEHNAKDVAAAVAREVREIDAQLVIVGGDVRARDLVLEQLPEPCRSRAVRAEHGGRAPGVDQRVWEAECGFLVREHIAARQAERIAVFLAGQPSGAAITGLVPIVDALRLGQVATLLVTPQAAALDGRTLWYGPEPRLLAMTELELRDIGVSDPTLERADAVLVRALVGTDASIEFVESADLQLSDGLGATLRPPPPHPRP